jgi:hypothetical protein
MPLTDTSIRNVKAGPKPIKLFDERGLFLIVTLPGASGGAPNQYLTAPNP